MSKNKTKFSLSLNLGSLFPGFWCQWTFDRRKTLWENKRVQVSAFMMFITSSGDFKSYREDYTILFIVIDPRSETGTNGMGTQSKLRSSPAWRIMNDFDSLGPHLSSPFKLGMVLHFSFL